MEQFLTVAEHNEAGRLDARLRHIIDLQAAALVRRRLDARLRVGEDVVEHAGGDAHGALVVDKVDELEQPLGALAGQGRDEQHRRVGHEAQVAQDVLAHFLHGAGLFVNQVPLVHDDDGRLARLVREAGDLRILLRDAVARVDHDQAHIRALDGELGAHDGEFLNAVVHARLAPDAGGIDKDIFAVFVLKAGVDAVARRAGDVADDDALFADCLSIDRVRSICNIPANGLLRKRISSSMQGLPIVGKAVYSFFSSVSIVWFSLQI